MKNISSIMSVATKEEHKPKYKIVCCNFKKKGKLCFEWRVLGLTPRIIYRATVTNESKSEARKYIGLADTFKECYRKHTKDLLPDV